MFILLWSKFQYPLFLSVLQISFTSFSGCHNWISCCFCSIEASSQWNLIISLDESE
uniref:Uncharacterized protein n=1 Tax=Rhizophora mucronata TaxID=61149 RepID=A0A2P2PY01_RHIMU